MKIQRIIIILLSLLLTSTVIPIYAENRESIELSHKNLKVSITPSTLEVVMTAGEQAPFVISSPSHKPYKFTALKSSESSASWELPEMGINIKFQLLKESLQVNFTAAKPGRINFPIQRDNNIKSFIIPFSGGSYVPADDKNWIAFLKNQGPLDTTADLSIPFWGLEYKNQGVTFIILNQFDNRILFNDKNGRLTLKFSHRFRYNWKKKEIGFIIIPHRRNPITPAKLYRKHLIDNNKFITLTDKIKKIPNTKKLIGAAHIYLWGDGISGEMLEKFNKAGFDRLWLGIDSWPKLYKKPGVIPLAKKLGYLIATYDSYNSIHHPDAKDTWETARFDLELYNKGAVVGYNRKKRKGFIGRGYILSPLVAMPYVKKRVAGIMKKLPFNSWFIDCDAYGQLYDDYSKEHPANKYEDMTARLQRMSYIRDKYNLVIGSERGSAYSVPIIHFAHGMMTPVIGWGDPDMRKDRKSKYFLGGWYPPECPKILCKQVPLKEELDYIYMNPKFRIPLYQTVFRDSIITTHHWEFGSLKFTNRIVTNELLELLYCIPPLYNLNEKEFKKHAAVIKNHYKIFSPLHKKTALLPLTDFQWLTEDRMVQRTVFGEKTEIIANFKSHDFKYGATIIPAESIAIKYEGGDRYKIYTPPSSP